jgi:3-phenylpropionate/cinnamic acid dioxygenase small subunit
MSIPDADTRYAAEQFLFHEARLLDAARWDDWLALFADDGWYWLPAHPGQTDPVEEISIVYEDPTVLRLRVARLKHPHAWTLTPAPRTAHVIGNVTVANGHRGKDGGDGNLRVESMVTVAEFRGGDTGDRRLYAGRQTHELRPDPDSEAGYKIALKRLDLIDCDAASGAINVIL